MKRNLGVVERVIRPMLGLVALGVVASREQFGPSEAVVALLGGFLILNGVAARCYLWRLLGINTADPEVCDLDTHRQD